VPSKPPFPSPVPRRPPFPYPIVRLSLPSQLVAPVVAARVVKSWPVCNQSDNVTLRQAAF
jgi:hypothetical protein